MKQKMLCAWVIIAFIMSSVAIPTYAGDAPAAKAPSSHSVAMSQGSYSSSYRMSGPDWHPPGELIIADAVILRPLGIIACAIGFVAASTYTLPWASSSDSFDRVENELIRKPFEYTFKRPLGDMDMDY